jgi:autotransporter-associated beta strand protein
MKLAAVKTLLLALLFTATAARAVTINAVYFAQTHVLKASDPYFGLVGNREALIKVHVTDPATPASPTVTATLSLAGNTNVLTLTGPATLPASIPDGPGVVQHSYANTFTGIIPAAWVKKGLTVTVNAGAASTSITNLNIGAPTKVIMTMFDVQYFADTTGNYPSGAFAEVEAKWPVADLEVRRLGHVVFPELVIPPRQDVGTKAVRIKSKAEYFVQTGLNFDGEQSAALAWNGALKRAAGRSGRWSLYYLNVYNAFAGGQAGGFAGVGSGTNVGILHHELGHALSLPHWGDHAAYPYKGAMHGIPAPSNYNGTHAGPAWAFHLPTRAFIPPTVQANNVGGNTAGTYKVDPMQGGGTGYQEPAYLLNHFSDYSVNQMRSYLQSHVVVWNAALNSWAAWNQTAGDYTTTVSNNGVQFPTTRDVSVISILASVSGANPAINMVYPPIGPYTSGLIRLFDPTVAADRTAAQSIFAPTNGCDYCVRVVQGGVTKTYMLAASNLSTADPFAESSLITEAVNLPASGGAVTKIELLSTPNVEDVGLPANPTVLSTWAPLTLEAAAFEEAPRANSANAITMTAQPGALAFGYTGTIEYQFTETTGNPGGTTSAWQTSRTYTDTGLQAGTQYSYTVAMRAGSLTTTASAPASATTPSLGIASPITVNATQTFTLASGSGYKAVTGLGTFNPAGADKLVIVIAGENANNDHFAFAGVRYNGVQMTEIVQQTGITADGAVAIYYLDNPPALGSITVSGYNLNGGLGVAYALTGTKPGYGAFTSRRGSTVTSVPLTTSANNSLVIAALQNSGNPNGAGTPTATAPLTQAIGANWGGGWGSLASGYIHVATPGNAACAFSTSTSSTHSINLASVEFLAQTVPASTWTQTAGGAQNWTTAANWIGNTVPSPLAGDTVDFSAVDIAANTTLTLGANRTGGLWKFGDTAGAENWTVNAGHTITLAGTTPTIEVTANTAQLDCVLAGSAGLAKTGAGTLLLNAANTYTGGTTLTNGTLALASAAALGAGTLTIGSGNTPTLRNDSGSAMTLGNSLVWAGNFRTAGSFDFGTATVSINTNSTQEITSGTLTIGGVMSGAFGINKLGTGGTLVLTGLNTFTGTSSVRQGTLSINTLKNYGVASALGAPASGSIIIAQNNSSTLNYTGTGDTTNRTIQIASTTSAGTTATVANNGTGPLIFTAAAFNTPVGITSGSAARTLALGGSFGTTATPNEVRGVIADNLLNGATAPANRVSLSKAGNGAWKISGANTYTGTTTISAGTLILGANNVLPDTAVTLGAATLDADTRTDTAGTLDITAAATIRFGSGGALAFADSSAVDWGTGTLALTGTFVSGSSLRFGTSATALTATQLGKISRAGVLSFTLDANGYLIAHTGATFANWQTANGTAGAINADHDNDGVPNGIEWFLGGNTNTTGHTALPGVVNTSGTLRVTWVKSSAFTGTYGTNFTIETTDTLFGPWTPEPLGTNVTITGNNVTYTFPAPPGARKFARLRVTIP